MRSREEIELDRKKEEELYVANMNKLSIKGNSNNTPDEDGWVEVKSKKKDK